MAEQVPKMLPTVPKMLLKCHKKYEDIRQAHIAARKATTMLCKDKQKDVFKHAKRYVKEYWQIKGEG